MKHKSIILHIPHSAINIPLGNEYALEEKLVNNEILKTTDWYTDDLYFSEDTIPIIFEYSRIFCVPERFPDDEQEPMAKKGMGVLYDKTDDNKTLRIITPEIRKSILDNYYWKHHKKLSEAVEYQLKKYNRLSYLIVILSLIFL